MELDIGILIREIRNIRKLGLNEFAEKSGLDAANLSRFERGGGGVKMPEGLYPMARALNTTVPALFLILGKAQKDSALLKNQKKLEHLFDKVNAAIAKI